MKSDRHGTFLVSLMLGVVGSPSAYADKKVPVSPTELPEVIRQAIEKTFPNWEILEISQEVKGKDPGQYDVDIRSGGKKYEVEITPKGVVKESKER